MNHPVLSLLAALLAMLQEAMPAIIERLPGAQVQKFRDAIEQIEQALAHPEYLDLHQAADPGELPPFVTEIMTMFKGEVARRAGFDDEQAQRAERFAVAAERIAASLTPSSPAV